MKKFSILVLSLVLTAAFFAGCGCTNTNGNASTPTGMTEPMPTAVTTQPTTRPTAAPTVPTVTQPDTGNGALEDDSTGVSGATTESTTPAQSEDANGAVRGRARGVVPNSGR